LQASRSSIFSIFTFTVVAYSAILSVSRILALWHNYHAPLSVVYALESQELPRLLNISGMLPPPPVLTEAEANRINNYPDEGLRLDLSPIKDFDLTLCVAKEWHRFPGHYLVPEGVRVEFAKSEFDGLVPGKFTPVAAGESGLAAVGARALGTRVVPQDQNDLNRAEPSHYVSLHPRLHALHY
jgi:alpha-1,2-mannosyltransferase